MKIKEKLPAFFKDKKSISYLIMLLLSLITMLSFLLFNPGVFASTHVNSSLANLTIWDTTDSAERYSYPTCYEIYGSFRCTLKNFEEHDTFFYANFTNKTSGGAIPNSEANCSIKFDENLTGTFTDWINMTYSSSRGQYEYNRSFKFKGGIPFEVNCTDPAYGLINSSEDANISNTAPAIYAKNAGGKLPVQSVTEDILFYYNFSMNCTDDDLNDIPYLVYGYDSGSTTLTNFTFDTHTGNLTINISTDNDVGDGKKKISFRCNDTTGAQDTAEMNFTVSAVNDAPAFTNLNSTMNTTEGQEFSFQIQAGDEENNEPFSFNATFTSCDLASWSDRGTNCTLFVMNSSGYLAFNATNNDVGNYTIEFNVTDAGNAVAPYNATRTETIEFTVINANNLPALTFLCNENRNASEDINFACWISANDTDEASTLTFSSNETWFTFNNSQSSETKTAIVNTTVQVNFTANDSAVGYWQVNLTVTDSYGGANSSVIGFNVSNINDTVALGLISNWTSYLSVQFSVTINASDNDLLSTHVPKAYTEDLSFSRTIDGPNTNLFTITETTTSENASYALISFMPTSGDVGNYIINISVTDSSGNIDSQRFNITIYDNSVPYWNDGTEFNFVLTDNSSAFSLDISGNVTDPDADSITFTDNATIFDITSGGVININRSIINDSFVGTHWVNITITDARGAANTTGGIFNFTIYNTNETPILASIAGEGVDEDSLITINFSATDEDLIIPASTENLKWSINSSTVLLTATRLNFTQLSNTSSSISFTPGKTDVGVHTINITVNDSAGKEDSQEFTLTITGINHAPVPDLIGPRNATENQEFYLDLNVTDIEDGRDNLSEDYSALNTNFTFTSNESTWFAINETTGIINTTPNSSYIGIWWINITVNDSDGKSVSEVFNISIYSSNTMPTITNAIPASLNVNTFENCTFSTCRSFLIEVRDRDAGPPNNDLMTVEWKVDGVTNSTETNVTNNTQKSLKFYANFTDEGIRNVSVWVSDLRGNTTVYSWNVSVNHTNAPPQVIGIISNITISGATSVNVSCDMSSSSGMCESGGTSVSAGGYFLDIDHQDTKYNYSINLTWVAMDHNCNAALGSPKISVNMNRDTLKTVFYTTETAAECFNITATDFSNSTYNITSNNFIVNLTVLPSTSVPVPTPSPGGGGGGKRKTPVALKIVVPEPVTMFTIDRIVVPISLENVGQINLYDINLSATSSLKGIQVDLSEVYFSKLLVGEKESLEMTVLTKTNETGTYEIVVSASSNNPKYTDTASFFVNLIELGWKEKIKAQEKVIFLEELLLGNPECLELQEVLEEAKLELERENYKKALEMAESAVQACKYAVSSRGRTIELGKRYRFQDLVLPLLEALFAFLILYSVYHNLQRRTLRRRK